MKSQVNYKKIIALIVIIFTSSLLLAQNTKVTGAVTDATNRQVLPYVTVSFLGSTIGTNTDDAGRFTISSKLPYDKIKVSFVGFKSAMVPVKPGENQVINVQLYPETKQLTEVVIKSGKNPKYSNRENPAVELIRKVIANKNKNRPDHYAFVEYKEYDKMMFGLTNVSATLSDKKFFHKFNFLIDNRDSTTVPGKNILPIYLDEKISQNYYRQQPEKKKTIVLAHKGVNFGNYVDNEGIGQYFKHVYYDIDIYSNNIYLFSSQFLSPIADGAPAFYKFFITDTISIDNTKVVELSFTPRNTTDKLFEGKIYITLDGNYAVERALLTVNNHINLNFVRSLQAKLDFEKNPDGRYHMSKSTIIADFGLNKNPEKGGLIGMRTIRLKDYLVDQARTASVYRGDALEVDQDAANRSNNFWMVNRFDTLSTAESKVYHNIDTLKTLPAYQHTMDILTLFLAGYKSFGPFEVGPAQTFYSFNPVEGFRLRVGGRTTPELSKRYYFETYAAYGFKDERWKYFLSATYSINNKSIYKFPQDYIRASFQRDTKIPGAELEFIQEDNFLLSFKRGNNDKYLYNDLYKVDYVHELENHFSYSIGFKNWTQSPAGSLYFNNVVDGVAHSIINLTTTEATVQLRYAPHEEFYQGKIYRVPVYNHYPIFTLDFAEGIKDAFGGQYNYQRLHFGINKRTYLSQLGYADVFLDAGHIFGQVPFPLLTIPRANQTYAYDIDSYNLMNFLEFVTDHYESINIDQHFGGFFFNKVPLLKKLKWREVMSFKALWGGVSNQNNPELHPELYQFPVDGNGKPMTYALGNTPYIEGSVGIENIFKVFRVDLVRRFDYLDHPEVAKWGIRTRAVFNF
jgi:hypothetical protein